MAVVVVRRFLFNYILVTSYAILDINECLSSPCPNTMKCENSPGSYQCIEGCNLGYVWSIRHGECRGKTE